LPARVLPVKPRLVVEEVTAMLAVPLAASARTALRALVVVVARVDVARTWHARTAAVLSADDVALQA
jgi:hypothetical protein